MILTSRYTVLSLLVAIMLLAGWVLQKGMPGQLGTTEELVRLRNALLIEPSSAADFDWKPTAVPSDFPTESGEVPAAVRALSDRFSHVQGNWNRFLATVNYLRRNGPNGRAIQSDTITTLAIIQDEGKGYCSDFTQVVNALAYSNGLGVREWGISFDGFGGWGHAFSEVFIPEFDQWVFIDVFHGFYVTRNGRPLSVLQFRQLLLDSPGSIEVQRLEKGRFKFRSDADAISYYSRGLDEFYLWWGNDTLSYDQNPLVKAAGRLSRSLEQLVAIAIGRHPTIRILDIPQNREQQNSMKLLKWQLLGAFWLEILLSLCLAFVLVYRRNNRLPLPQGS